jgi:homoserine O-acetyltransferase
LGWLGDTPGFNGDIHAAFASIRAKALFIYNIRDEFYLPRHIEEMIKAVPNARGEPIDSIAGHLICCNADPQATWVMSEAIRRFLQDLRSPEEAAR